MTPKFKLKLMIPVLIVSCITFLRIGMQHWAEAAVEEPVNCAAFKIDPIIGLHSSRLSRQQVLAKLHFHKQQMKHQIVTNDRVGRHFFQRNWEPSYSCTALARFGCPGDGGKWICDPHHFLMDECVVYSVGSRDEFSFEEAIHHFNPKCRIYTFDPFSSKPVHKPDFVEFYPWGIGARDSAKDSIFTLPTIMRKLHHENITILKVDCEGCELDLDALSFPAHKGAIQQIQMEVHFDGVPERMHRLFNFLTSIGYAIFNKEANIEYSDGDAVEFSLLFVDQDVELRPRADPQ
jgi:hypothetical protein